MREILDTLWVVAVTVWEFVVAAIKFLNDYNGAVTAAATVFIGAFTYVLARVTRRQADLTRQSIDLTRQDFLSTHRPVLRVRAFKLVGGSYKEIRFVVASVGAGTAYLLGSR